MFRCLLLLLLLLLSPPWALAWHDSHLDGDTSPHPSTAFAPPDTPPKYPPSAPYQIHHLKLELTILPASKQIAGQVTLSVSAKAKPLSSLTLHAAELQIQEIRVLEEPTSWSLEGHSLTLALRSPLRPGHRVPIRIVYRASPRIGLHFVGPTPSDPKKPLMVFSQGEDQNNRFWYPSFDAPPMRFTSETLFTVPAPFQVISNGRFLSKTEKNGMITYHHTMEKTHVNYLLSVVVGVFAEYKQVWKGIPIRSLVPPADIEKAARSFENTADMMDFFSEKIGFPYPFAKYDQVVVHDFVAGGMENITATTLTYKTLHDAAAHLDERSDHLVAHELAHQWFGDILTCKDWSHLWLNESFATYFDQLYTEKKWGQDEFDSQRFRSRASYFASPYHRPIETRIYELSWDVFDAHAYPKGAAVLHMIRRTLGDDLWWKAIQTYVQRHAFGLVETDDLRRVLEDLTGGPWQAFFDQWLRRPGHPIFRFTWAFSHTTKLLTATLEQTQADLFRLTVPLVVTTAQGQRLRFSLQIRQKREVFKLPLDAPPTLVEADPAADLLAEIRSQIGWTQAIVQLHKGSALASRIQAARRLGHFPHPPDTTRALLAVLRDPSLPSSLRQAAASALSEIASKEACQGLLSALSVRESKVRSEIASSLGRCRLIAPLDALAQLLRSDPSYYVRTSAVYAIARLRDPRSFALLEEAYPQDAHHGMIQSAALQAMVSLEDPKAFPYLVRSLPPGRPRDVRRTALSAFARLARLLRKERLSSDLQTLLPFLRDPDPFLEQETVTALGILGDPRAIPHLRRYARQAPVEGRARHARRSIQQILDQEALLQRFQGFQHSLDSVRLEQRKLLERLRSLERIHLFKR